MFYITPLLNQASQRKLVEYISAFSNKKIDKLLDSGLDPNFLTEDGSKYD